MSLDDMVFVKMPKEWHERFQQSAGKDSNEHPPVTYDRKGNRIYFSGRVIRRDTDDDEIKSEE